MSGAKAAGDADRLMRRRHVVDRVHALGPRALGELLAELARRHPEIAEDIDDRLAAYADRLTPEMLRATGGDRWPASPLRAVGGGR